MVVSDHLTWIAEVTVNAVLRIAWHHLVQRHGLPHGVGSMPEQSGFAVIAYGKLGGIELGYGSDLDLVFLYDADGNAMTDGERPVANAVFYSRLGQRMIHIFTAVTPAGALYETDMRLRPSGASGLLVTRVDSFGEYQRSKAWTWEHQALVRARAVAGDSKVVEAFDQIRQQVLASERDQETVREEVRKMRERMRKELDKSGKGLFDLKQGCGGIADIEFMVQYAVLAYAHRQPGLLVYTDNIRGLEAMVKAGLIAEKDGEQLSGIYRAFRARIHQLTLQQAAVLVDEQSVAEQCAVVNQCWKKMMGSSAGDQE
jgi:glutamate-ammonia-ligase adenylyltransferase